MLEAERLGYDSVWSGEAYGTDAVTPTAWILARTTRIRAGTGIMQMQARTPACTAMTALTLQALSNNRFLLGIGASGPQVVEGWHGVPFGKPMARTREYIEILRKILKREAALQHDGELYQIPYKGAGATGLGKPLKSILHGDPNMPIYAASITPIGLRTAGEVADGVLPIFMSPEKTKMVTEPLLAGIAKGPAGRSLADFDVAPYVRIAMGDDLQACREALKPELALYIGGMGARTKNFYNDFTKHLGYEEAAVKIQDAFLSGKRAEAIAAVPDTLVDEVSLVGSPERIKDRLQAWKEAGKEACGRLDAAERRDGRLAARRRRSRALRRVRWAGPWKRRNYRPLPRWPALPWLWLGLGRRRAHVGAGHASHLGDGVIGQVDRRMRLADRFFVRTGHEAESLAVLQIDMRSMAENAELLGGRLERGELLVELLFRQHLRRESALALVVGVDEVLHVGFSRLNVVD